MNIHLISTIHFEKWYWANLDQGIGGSETHHIEIAWRLARRGHKVFSYAPVPWKGAKENRDVIWKRLEEADYSAKGLWITYRCPELLDKFKKGQRVWLICQDESYSTWTKERAAKVERIICLCQEHARNMAIGYPYLKEKICVSSNGVRMDLIREVEKQKIERNPKRMIYCSSPDRGLKQLVQIFNKVREFVPDIELVVTYGFNNINKLIKFSKSYGRYKKVRDELLEMMKAPGIIWMGRVSQKELYKLHLSSGIWCYPTAFGETSCITCMEAQALGSIPITNPYWALAENVKHGTFIQGDNNDPLTQSRYTSEVIRLAMNPKLQEQIRKEMIPYSRYRFNWERWVDQLEGWAVGIDNPWYFCQYAFQLKHAKGKIINIGCDVDAPNFKALGATNVDILKKTPILNTKTKADIIADARDLPKSLYGKYDTAILGEILEHYRDEDICTILKNAKKCLRKGGRIVITCPEDYRPTIEQHGVHTEPYSDTGSSMHEYPLTKEKLCTLIHMSGLTIDHSQIIDYTFALGIGIICS